MQRIAYLPFLIILLSLTACSPPTGMRVGGIEYVYSEAQGRAFHAASTEAESLPEAFDIESIYTEGAVLRNDLIMELLSIRGIKFIETQIRRSTYEPTEGYGYLGMSYIRGEPGLNIGRRELDKTYARIELSESNDPRCIQKSWLPGSIANRIDYPPFLPGTCIALTIIDQPTSRYRLIYEGKHDWGPPFGHWTLIDVSSGNRLGSITTADSAERPQNGNTGHSFLSWRIRRAPGSFPIHPQTVLRRIVQPTQVPEGLSLTKGWADGPSVKRVTIESVEKVFLNKEKYNDIFNRQIHLEGWIATINDAKQARWGSHLTELLDWKQRTLTHLEFEHGKYGYWSSRGVEAGFFVFQGFGNKRSANPLYRFDTEGRFLWVVLVEPPDVDPTEFCGLGPYNVQATSDYVILHVQCGYVAGHSREEQAAVALKIRRRDLPRF